MSCQKKQINDEFWVICSVDQTVKSSFVYNLDFQFFFFNMKETILQKVIINMYSGTSL